MGVVYRARHCGLGRVAALKLIAPELVEDASSHSVSSQEAAVAASIDHPNVVPVHDAGETDGVAYLAMRYVDGADLHTTRAGRAVCARQAAAIVADGRRRARYRCTAPGSCIATSSRAMS